MNSKTRPHQHIATPKQIVKSNFSIIAGSGDHLLSGMVILIAFSARAVTVQFSNNFISSMDRLLKMRIGLLKLSQPFADHSLC